MLPALWVSKTGLSAQDMNLTTISNNRPTFPPPVSSVTEPSSRTCCTRYVASRWPVQPGQRTAFRPAAGYRREDHGHAKIFTTGSLQTTEQPLDMAINGRGFFQVLLPDGTVSYP